MESFIFLSRLKEDDMHSFPVVHSLINGITICSDFPPKSSVQHQKNVAYSVSTFKSPFL